MNRHISIFSVLLILGGCVTAPISPEFTERLDDVEREEKMLSAIIESSLTSSLKGR